MTSIFTRMLTPARGAALVAVTVAGTLSAAVVLAPPASAAPSTLYVAQGGADTGDCSVVASSCATVSYALTQAASGATINVSGTIKDRFSITAPVTITGVDAPADSPAVLDGDNGGTVVRVNPYAFGVRVTLDHLTIQHGANSDSLGGGGIQVLDNGIVTLSHAVISHNTSVNGGGGIESLGAVVVTDSTVSKNSSGGFGGGGIGAQHGSITVTRSTISGNSTSGRGGGIEMGTGGGGGAVTISGSTVTGNAASGNGGGVWADGGGTVAITTSTIAGNRGAAGGGVGFDSSVASLIATTIANNSSHFGGGIYAFATSLSIAAGIIANNGTACRAGGGSIVVSTFSLIDDSTCGDPGSGDISGDSGLADLADNGGPTRTMALSQTSPAANAIPYGTSDNGVLLCPRTSQNGTAAPVDDLAGCSMGAVEAIGLVRPLNTLYVAERGSNASNDCLAPGSPCATVTYALTQLPGSAMSSMLPVTIEVTGTVMDNVTVSTQRPITISGAAAPADSPAVLDGNSVGPVLVANTGADLELDHLTLQHGDGTISGGGGGLVLYNATARLRHVTVTANTSPLGGGGILNAGPGLMISDSTISGNTASTCEGCDGGIGGGGIATEAGTTTTVNNSTISGNTALGTGTGTGEGEGGGIFNLGTLTVNGSTISQNTAGYKGGGVAGTGSATINDSTIYGNSASTWGGGLDGNQLTVTHSTIDGNAAEKGTQIANEAGTITLAASIIGTGAGIGSCITVGSPATFASAGYNLDQDGSCELTGGTDDLAGVSPELGALADNGGPTATALPAAESPAAFSIPAGTTGNGTTLCPHADQRGVPGPVSGQAACSRGAVEATAADAPTFTTAASYTVPFGTRFSFPVTTGGGALATLAVAAGSSLPTAVTFTDNGDGSGALAGYVLHPGTYSFMLGASNGAGRTTMQEFTLVVTKRDQIPLTLTSLSGLYLTALPLTTSGGSGTGAVAYTAVSGTASDCTVAGSTLSATSTGTCTVTATKAGDENYRLVSSDPTTVTLVAPLPSPPSPPLGAGLSQATFVTGFNGVQDVATDFDGNVFVADMYNSRIAEYSPDGSLLGTIDVASPVAVAVDAAGVVYVAQWHATQILTIASDGTRRYIGGGFSYPAGIAVDLHGNVYVTDDSFNNLSKIQPNGTQVGMNTFSSGPKGVTTDAAGNIYVVDPGAHHVVQIQSDGSASPYGPSFPVPRGVEIDGAGNLYVSDVSDGGTLYFAAPDAITPTTLATDIGGGDVFASLDPDGAVYVSASGPNVVYRYTRAPQALPITATSVAVTWAPPAFPRGTTHYTATATDLTTTSNGGQTCTVTASGPEIDTCTVTGLAAGDTYTFTVTATNAFGTGAPSAPTNPVTVPTSGGTGGGYIPPAPVPPATAPVPSATAPVTTTVTAGGTASSSPDAHPTAANPVIASVQSPVPGAITFIPVDSADPQTGYTMLGHSFVISAPAATPDKPLQLSFAVDTSALPSGVKLSDLTVFRDGFPVPKCVGASGTASPDPCVVSVTTASDAASVKVLSSHASTWTFGVSQPERNRIGGANRYETAASIATAFGAANAVVVANGETVKQGFDALSASFLAGRAHAPILLTAATSLPPATASAVKQVLSGSAHPVVYVMGGKDSVSNAVAAALKTAAGGSKAKVIRVAGVSRYDTSVAAVTAMAGSNIGSIRLSAGSPLDKTAILASGVVNADALAAGALSAAWGIPVLLTVSNALPASIAAAIKDLKITQLIVLGGTDRVSAGAVGQAKAAGIASVKRIAGADRYATAAGLYAFVFDTAVDADGEHYGAGSGLGAPAYLANGVTGFPDALSVGPLAARSEAALLTTGPDNLATADARFLTAHAGTLTTVIALGTVTTLAAAVLAAAQKAIR